MYNLRLQKTNPNTGALVESFTIFSITQHSYYLFIYFLLYNCNDMNL